MAAKRIYIIREVIDPKQSTSRLVRASSQAQALRHVAEGRFLVDVANQEEIVHNITSGTLVEDAKSEEAL